MRIGVIGDTHNNLRSVAHIVEIFQRHEIRRVIHTGDNTQPKVLDRLSALSAEFVGVYGNNDLGERRELELAADRCNMSFTEGPLELQWGGRQIVVVHDPRELENCLTPEHDLALHGHTHLYRLESMGPTLVFNPGECAGMLKGHNRVGMVDLSNLKCEIEHF